MKYKAVLFDLDGTLINTLDDLANITNTTLNEFGYPLRTLDEVRQFVGSGVQTLLERALPHSLPEEEFQAVYQRMRENYLRYQNKMTHMYDGIPELLKELKEQGYQTAIISNKMDPAVQALMPIYFQGLISTGVGVKEEAKKKPHPDMVLRAVKELGLQVEDCVYIGDSDIDILTGKNSGMDVISVTWGFRTKEQLLSAGANVMVDTPEELWKYI